MKVKTEGGRQLVQVPITRKEFLSLPMALRRKILRRQADQLRRDIKRDEFMDALDCEEDP